MQVDPRELLEVLRPLHVSGHIKDCPVCRGQEVLRRSGKLAALIRRCEQEIAAGYLVKCPVKCL